MANVFFGEVKRYDSSRGCGFIAEIKEHGTEQFFHINSVVGHITLRVGDLVTFEITPSTRKPGLTEAMNVRLSKRDANPVATATQKQAAPAAEVRQ